MSQLKRRTLHNLGYERIDQSHADFGSIPSRVPLKSSFNKKGKDDRFKAKGLQTVTYGKVPIQISGLEQLWMIARRTV